MPAQAGIHDTSRRVICRPCLRGCHRAHGRPRLRGDVPWVLACARMTLVGGRPATSARMRLGTY